MPEGCRVDLLEGPVVDGGMGGLPTLRVRARSFGANPGGLVTPPTAWRWGSRRWEASEVRTPGLPLYSLSRCCVCKFDGCVLKVPVGVLPAPAGVWGVPLAATPFALKLLAVCCGCCWWSSGSVKHCFCWRIEHWSSFWDCIIGAEWLPQSYVRCWWGAGWDDY